MSHAFRFFVSGTERICHDAQERISMLQHRLHSLRYWQSLLSNSCLLYYFRDETGTRVFALLEVDRLQTLDWMLKRDPAFPYLRYECQPVISTRDLIEEIQDYLDVVYFSPEQLCEFQPRQVVVDQNEHYVLVDKTQDPFSPLLSDEIQNEILKKTVASQHAHDSEIEISDVNPVGGKVGIHVSKVKSVNEARVPVESTTIFPDTNVKYVSLLTITQAQSACTEQLKRVGISPHED